MGVYKQKDRAAWTYEFQYQKRTYKGSTGQLTEADAIEFETAEKRKVRRQRAGLAVRPEESPHCQEWAGVYYTWQAQRKKVKRPERIDELNQVVLEFFGRRPKTPKRRASGELVTDAPYHDLRLIDPIDEPRWLDDFETWMERRGIAGSTRNHYRSTVSGWYRVARLPRYRNICGIKENPMEGVPRDRRVRRDVELEPTQMAAWIGVAAYHVRLAMAIAALAPKLRKENVLALAWDTHFDRQLTRIRIDDHKTDADGEPIVQMISAQLRAILQRAKQRTKGRYVVSYRGQRVRNITGGVRGAAARAGLAYGLKTRKGVTFHAIRHGLSTLFASLTVSGAKLSEAQRAALLSHSVETAQGYTHLNPVHELPALEALSAEMPLADLVDQPWRRWSERFRAGGNGGRTGGSTTPKTLDKPPTAAETAAGAARDVTPIGSTH